MVDFRKKLNPLIRWSVIFRFCWMNFSRNWPFRFQARTIQHVGRENWNLQEINCPRARHPKWIKIGKKFFSSFFVFLISLSYFIVSLQQIKELETTEEVLLQLIEVEKVEILANQPPPPPSTVDELLDMAFSHPPPPTGQNVGVLLPGLPPPPRLPETNKGPASKKKGANPNKNKRKNRKSGNDWNPNAGTSTNQGSNKRKNDTGTGNNPSPDDPRLTVLGSMLSLANKLL